MVTPGLQAVGRSPRTLRTCFGSMTESGRREGDAKLFMHRKLPKSGFMLREEKPVRIVGIVSVLDVPALLPLTAARWLSNDLQGVGRRLF